MRSDNLDREPDILLVILQLVATEVPGFPPETAQAIERTVRARYGGLRTRIPKRRKHPTPEQRTALVDKLLDSSTADVPTDQIAESAGLHRATLYRYLKRR